MSRIKQEYFRIDLHDPAVPSFCTLPKSFYGTLADISKAIACMEKQNVCPDTVDAFRRYLEGEQDAEHYVCYSKAKLLRAVELLSVEQFELDNAQWEHINTWDCVYIMRTSHVSVTQAVFTDGNQYCRCIKPQFTDLQYNGDQRGCWIDVGDCFWGNVGVMTACNDKCELMLFAEEQREADLDAIWANMGNEMKLDYSKACDEIFGNG